MHWEKARRLMTAAASGLLSSKAMMLVLSSLSSPCRPSLQTSREGYYSFLSLRVSPSSSSSSSSSSSLPVMPAGVQAPPEQQSSSTSDCHWPASGQCQSCSSYSSFPLPQFFTRLSPVEHTSAFPLGSTGLQLWGWSWHPHAARAQSSAFASW